MLNTTTQPIKALVNTESWIIFCSICTAQNISPSKAIEIYVTHASNGKIKDLTYGNKFTTIYDKQIHARVNIVDWKIFQKITNSQNLSASNAISIYVEYVKFKNSDLRFRWVESITDVSIATEIRLTTLEKKLADLEEFIRQKLTE